MCGSSRRSIPSGESFDLVIANLPYVAEADWTSLQPEVTQWEPREALLAGSDGLDAIRQLLSGDSGRRLYGYSGQATTGEFVLALEVGEGQAPAVAMMLREASFLEVESRRDLAGIERVVVGRR